jgi:hypothetical protein
MRSRRLRSACETALAAKIPHAVALRRDLEDFNDPDAMCTALSFRCRRESAIVSAIGARSARRLLASDNPRHTLILLLNLEDSRCLARKSV